MLMKVNLGPRMPKMCAIPQLVWSLQALARVRGGGAGESFWGWRGRCVFPPPPPPPRPASESLLQCSLNSLKMNNRTGTGVSRGKALPNFAQ